MKTAKGYFDMGYSAFGQGLSKEANPLLFGNGWPHEAWNLGYEFAELERNAPQQSETILERVPANPFQQGRNANIKGISFADCPYGEGKDKLTWEAGWISETEPDDGPKQEGWLLVAFVLSGLFIAGLVWAIVANAEAIEGFLERLFTFR